MTMKVSNKVWFSALLLCVSVIGSSAHGETLSPVLPTVGVTFARDLTVGASGTDVSALQQFLITGGFLKISTPTDYFGPLTRTALSAWQASLNIYPSVGYFGPLSRESMNIALLQNLIDKLRSQIALGTTTRTTTAPTQTLNTPAKTATTNRESGLPVRLTIPKLNVDAGFQYNGLTPDGAMEIPNNVVDIGWFTGSVRPGESGVAVVTGHVAQIRGGVMTKPGVFYTLNELRVGDTLSVLNDKGKTTTFVVRKIRNYDPSADATDVFTATDNDAHLNLITCDGTWIAGQLSFSQRLVVFTDAVE
ncbi:MAG: sortase [Candidatus Campbellbacteria bacterium]|nr:sortase [Candidatus Campbellbacteria bacterium]